MLNSGISVMSLDAVRLAIAASLRLKFTEGPLIDPLESGGEALRRMGTGGGKEGGKGEGTGGDGGKEGEEVEGRTHHYSLSSLTEVHRVKVQTQLQSIYNVSAISRRRAIDERLLLLYIRAEQVNGIYRVYYKRLICHFLTAVTVVYVTFGSLSLELSKGTVY